MNGTNRSDRRAIASDAEQERRLIPKALISLVLVAVVILLRETFFG